MIQGNNTNIDVDELMVQVQTEVLAREEQTSSPAMGHLARTYVYASDLDTTNIESLLHTADRMAAPRTKWSGRLARFPFNTPWFQRMALRLLAFLFNDQRHVNFALIQSARETLAMNREMHRVITTLQSEIRQLEQRLRHIEEPDAEQYTDLVE